MKHILLSFLVLAGSASQAQNPSRINCSKSTSGNGSNTFTYTYDYPDLKPDEDCSLKPRHKKDHIYVRINNINRLALDVQSKGVSTSIALPNISLFDSLAGKLNTANLSTSTNTVDGVPPDTKRVLQRGKNKNTYVSVPNPDPYLAKKKQIGALQKDINNHYQNLVNNLKQVDLFSKFAKNVPAIIGGECCSQDSVKLRLMNEHFFTAFHSGQLADFAAFQSVVNTEPITAVNAVISETAIIKKAKEDAEKLLAEIRKACKNNKTQDQDICDIDDLEDNFPDDLEKVLEQASKVLFNDVAAVVTQVNDLLVKVNNPQNFRYLSPRFGAEGDNMNVHVTIKPKPAFSNNYSPDSIDIPFRVRGKFEWAIGPSLNFHISKSLFDRSYQIDSAYNAAGKAKQDTFSIKRNPTRNRYLPSVGVMAHFYWQNHSSLTPGIAVGVSTSPADISELRAYLGGSFLIGDLNNKLIISLGVAGGSVNRLKVNLVEGENPKSQVPFKGDQIGSPDDLVEKVFQVGVFFGLTYKINN